MNAVRLALVIVLCICRAKLFLWVICAAEKRNVVAVINAGNVTFRTVAVDPDLIIDQPTEEEIRTFAGEITQQGPSLQDLHWLIAERRYIYKEAKK